MEVFDFFLNEQRFTVYPDEWQDGIHQVKTVGGKLYFLRMKSGLRWEELDPATLDPMGMSDDSLVQLLGSQIQDKLPTLYTQELLLSTL